MNHIYVIDIMSYMSTYIYSYSYIEYTYIHIYIYIYIFDVYEVEKLSNCFPE